MSRFDLAVIGGGAAGFFGAIAFAESRPGARIVILEKSPDVLTKVKISGGGRCNVTHDCFDPRELVLRYPRGERSLIGPFHRFGPGDTIDWFAKNGVELKTEADGRMFPVTDNSQTVIDALMNAATRSGIDVWTRCEALSVEKMESGDFALELQGASSIEAGAVLMTTGGIRGGSTTNIVEAFGHKIETAAPSLFTFKIPREPRLEGLLGISMPSARVSVPGTKLSAETGPVLITHWGLSGPAILRLSAWGARELQAKNYQFDVVVDWTGLGADAVREQLAKLREASPKKQVMNTPSFGLPSRLWQRLAESAGVPSDQRWSHLSKNEAKALVRELCECSFAVTGKSMNKEEFVTCGGVSLKEVNFKTMESRKVDGLYFAGEVLDIDGVTGGFNFQAAWTTGRIAGESAGTA